MERKEKEEKKRQQTQREEMLGVAMSEAMEDATRYGEFVSTYFAWIPPKVQKEKAEELEEMTKKQPKK